MATQYFVVGPAAIVTAIVADSVQYRNIPAGQPLNIGDIVYQNGQYASQALANSTTTMDGIGLVTAAVASGVTANVLIRGRISGYAFISGLTSGGALYVHTTSAGLYTQTGPNTSGQVVQFFAQALTQNSIEINPRQGYQLGGP